MTRGESMVYTGACALLPLWLVFLPFMLVDPDGGLPMPADGLFPPLWLLVLALMYLSPLLIAGSLLLLVRARLRRARFSGTRA